MDVISRFHELLRRRDEVWRQLRKAGDSTMEKVAALHRELETLQVKIDATLAEASKEPPSDSKK